MIRLTDMLSLVHENIRLTDMLSLVHEKLKETKSTIKNIEVTIHNEIWIRIAKKGKVRTQ